MNILMQTKNFCYIRETKTNIATIHFTKID